MKAIVLKVFVLTAFTGKIRFRLTHRLIDDMTSFILDRVPLH